MRACIAKLKKEGYEFKYTELIGVKHKTVLEELKTSHIVLNEFYALVPGIFGIEAMANFCALITSADPKLEKDLPQDSQNAWMITKPEDLYNNLKKILRSKSLQKQFARNGYLWAKKHALAKHSADKFLSIVKKAS